MTRLAIKLFWHIIDLSVTVVRHCFLCLSLQPSVRKTHNSGRKHKESVKLYYMNWLEQEAQNMMGQPGAIINFVATASIYHVLFIFPSQDSGLVLAPLSCQCLG